MRSGRQPKLNLQAVLGVALLALVVGGMSWLVLSIGANPQPPEPMLSPTAIAAPTDIAQLPTPTATPRALPTRPATSPPTPAATAEPTRAAVEVAQVATLPPGSGPTPTPRVIKTLPTVVAATATPANTSGIAQVVEPAAPVGPADTSDSAATYPTPAPLVEAPPPTATPLPTFAPEIAQAQPTPAPRPTRQAGGIPTFPPVGSRGSNPAGTSDSTGGAFFPIPPGTMPTVVVRQPSLPGAGPGDVARSNPNTVADDVASTVVLPGITKSGSNPGGGFWPDGVPTPPGGNADRNNKAKNPTTATPTPRSRPGQQVDSGSKRPSLPSSRGNNDTKKNNDKNKKGK